MAPNQLPRVTIAARLKAARWLYAAADENGKPKAASTGVIAQLPQLAENRITRNRLEEIEQSKVDARSMELEKISEALGLPPGWFTERDWRSLLAGAATDETSTELAEGAAAALPDVVPDPSTASPKTGDTDRSTRKTGQGG